MESLVGLWWRRTKCECAITIIRLLFIYLFWSRTVSVPLFQTLHPSPILFLLLLLLLQVVLYVFTCVSSNQFPPLARFFFFFCFFHFFFDLFSIYEVYFFRILYHCFFLRFFLIFFFVFSFILFFIFFFKLWRWRRCCQALCPWGWVD